jgi:hypothetical protein
LKININHVAFVVRDLGEAMEEFSLTIGLQWRPVQSGLLRLTDREERVASVDVSYTYSMGPAPAVELFEGTGQTMLGEDLAASDAPRFHHLGIWSNDLLGDVAVTERGGWPLRATVAPAGAPPRNALLKAPFGYLELNDVHTYRDWIGDLYPQEHRPDVR